MPNLWTPTQLDAIERKYPTKEVKVEVQCGAEALDQCHRAGARCVWREPGLLDQVRGNDAVDDAQYLAHERLRQNLIHQQGGTLRHAPRPATGAEKPRRLQLKATRCSACRTRNAPAESRAPGERI